MKLKTVEQWIPHDETIWLIRKEVSWKTRLRLKPEVYRVVRDGEMDHWARYHTLSGARHYVRLYIAKSGVQVPFYLLPINMQRYLQTSHGPHYAWSELAKDGMLDLIEYGWIDAGNFRRVPAK